jgi:hypothetical protein
MDSTQEAVTGVAGQSTGRLRGVADSGRLGLGRRTRQQWKIQMVR